MIVAFSTNPTRLNGNSVASQNISGRFTGGREDCAVEETPVRTVTETVVVLPSATLDGVTLQVEFAGAPVQVKVAVPGNVGSRAKQQWIDSILSIRDRKARASVRIQGEVNAAAGQRKRLRRVRRIVRDG